MKEEGNHEDAIIDRIERIILSALGEEKQEASSP